MDRRTFLKTMGAASAGLTLAACQGQLSTPAPATALSPGRMDDPAATVAIEQAKTYERKLVRQQVQAALDALGGISDIVRPGASVALKVNLTKNARPPSVSPSPVIFHCCHSCKAEINHTVQKKMPDYPA